MTWKVIDSGDILQSSCDVITIPVNCVGVMGAGLALQAKQQWPAMYSVYRDLCRQGFLHLGSPEIVDLYDDARHRKCLLFPTKGHFSERSKDWDIYNGLIKIVRYFHDEDFLGKYHSLAIPALGCGLGQLPWDYVLHLMEEKLMGLAEEIDIEIYSPIRITEVAR